ncbi:MAG TPA: TetR/AcrR family transcriptional regulator [Acidimicrobiales bacterium]|nr:TetR/AcrR family transcriptional regulator [Acidimicrobiales bacterium]
MTAPSKPRRRLSAADRRSQLIDVGRQTFADLGYEAATVEEIARRAGITKPIIYGHFGGKDGLYSAVVEQETTYILEAISGAISTGPPRERVQAAALRFLEYVRDHRAGFTVLARDSPAHRQYASMLAEIAALVGEVFADEFGRAGYDSSVAPIYAQALIGMVTYVGQWWDEDRSRPVEEVGSHLAALAWMGLRHLPRTPSRVTPSET